MEQLPYIRLFGRVGLSFGTASAERFSTLKCHELVAFLSVVRGRDMRRDAVCRALWPDDPVSVSSRNRLSVTTYMLRKECHACGVPFDLFVRSDRLSMAVLSGVETDYAAFSAASVGMRAAKDDGHRLDHARRIVDLYVGPFAEGLTGAWLTALRAEARRTFQEAVLVVAKAQSAEAAAETLRQAVLADMDADGSVTAFLHWMAEQGSWDVVEDVLGRLESSSSSRARRLASDFRRLTAGQWSMQVTPLHERPTLAACVVDEPHRLALAQVQAKGIGGRPTKDDFVLLANPVAAERTAREVLSVAPEAKVSLHLVVMDPGSDLPEYVRARHATAMEGKLWVSIAALSLIEETITGYGDEDDLSFTPSA